VKVVPTHVHFRQVNRTFTACRKKRVLKETHDVLKVSCPDCLASQEWRDALRPGRKR
jgi:hypothetical protein